MRVLYMHEAMLMSATWGVVIGFHEQCGCVCSCVSVCMCGVCMWGFASMCMSVFVYAWDRVDVYYILVMIGYWLSLKSCVRFFVCVCVGLTGKLRFDGAIPFSANRCSRPGRGCACTHTHTRMRTRTQSNCWINKKKTSTHTKTRFLSHLLSLSNAYAFTYSHMQCTHAQTQAQAHIDMPTLTLKPTLTSQCANTHNSQTIHTPISILAAANLYPYIQTATPPHTW